jgi:hypothetical protein
MADPMAAAQIDRVAEPLLGTWQDGWLAAADR